MGRLQQLQAPLHRYSHAPQLHPPHPTPVLFPREGVQAAWAGTSGLHLGLEWRVPASLLAPLSPPKTALIKIKFSFLHHPCPWVLDPRLSAGEKLADGVCQVR